jgi:hypothetical protein
MRLLSDWLVDLTVPIMTDAYHLMAPWLGRGIPGLKGYTRNDRKLVVHLFALLSLRRPGYGVRFAHVRAHQGEFGNEWADVSGLIGKQHANN